MKRQHLSAPERPQTVWASNSRVVRGQDDVDVEYASFVHAALRTRQSSRPAKHVVTSGPQLDCAEVLLLEVCNLAVYTLQGRLWACVWCLWWLRSAREYAQSLLEASPIFSKNIRCRGRWWFEDKAEGDQPPLFPTSGSRASPTSDRGNYGHFGLLT